MVKIRLMRMGSMKNPHYRLVVVDGRTKRSGDYIEQIGYYDPRETTSENLRVDRRPRQALDGAGRPTTDTALRLSRRRASSFPPR